MTITGIWWLAAPSSLLCACMWVAPAPLSAHDQSFTLDQIRSGPFSTDLIAAGLNSLSALALARGFDMLAAGVDYAGVHEGSTLSRFLTVPGASPEKAHAAFDSSPVSPRKSRRTPALVVQGEGDRDAQLSQMMQAIESFRKQGVEFERIEIAGEVHGLILYAKILTDFKAANDFLHRHLISSQEQR